jgi:hypothetical protein
MKEIIPAQPQPITAPISLRSAPAFIKRHAGKDADDIMDKMIDAAGEFSTAATRIADGINTIMADKMNTQLRNMQRARDLTWKRWEAASKKGDQVRSHVEASITQLEKETQPKPPSDKVYAGEIRSRIAAMDPKTRMTVLGENIADQDVIGAAVHGSSLLTGLTATERTVLLQNWRQKHHGAMLERIARHKAALADLDRMHGMLMNWVVEMHQEKNAASAAAEHSEKLARAAMEAA